MAQGMIVRYNESEVGMNVCVVGGGELVTLERSRSTENLNTGSLVESSNLLSGNTLVARGALRRRLERLEEGRAHLG